MRKSLLILALLMALQMVVQAQMFTGRVVNTQNQPVEAAHIISGTFATTTRTDGGFTLDMDEVGDNIMIGCVGYKSIVIAADSLPVLADAAIVLPDTVYTLQVTEVTAQTPYAILCAAIDKTMAAIKPVEGKAFYRQVHEENGIYVRLLEADVSALHQMNKPDKVKVNQLRRSLVFERNGDDHGDHLVDLMEENMFYHPAGTILDKKAARYFELKIKTDSIFSGNTEIEYSYQDGSDPKLHSGSVVINADGFIIAVTDLTAPNPTYWSGGRFGAAGNTHWEFISGELFIGLAHIDAGFMPLSVTKHYMHHISDRFSGIVRYKVAERFTLNYYDLVAGSESCDGFKVHGGLYGLDYEYNPAFWNAYPLTLKYPLCKDVVADLETHKPLTDQFFEAGR